jgi:hypothetical protein
MPLSVSFRGSNLRAFVRHGSGTTPGASAPTFCWFSMTAQFITRGVWKSITASAKAARKPALVAVAYFGQGASKLMPLPAGSRLVVDASEGAVKSGQTLPADLVRIQKRGAPTTAAVIRSRSAGTGGRIMCDSLISSRVLSARLAASAALMSGLISIGAAN